MDKDLKKQLQKIITGHRPRPLMYIGYVGGKKCYVRKRDLTYWQLREIYPPLRPIDILPKPRHIFQKKHHLDAKRLQEHIVGYCIAAAGIVIFVSIVIFYLYLLVRR